MSPSKKMNFRIRSFRLLPLLFFLSASVAYATHERSGDLQYTYIGNNTFRVVVTTFTDQTSVAADRDSIEVNWGDGIKNLIVRVEVTDLTVNIRRNRYEGTHTYAGYGTYIIGMKDLNRIQGVQNINASQSVDIPLYFESLLVFADPAIYGSINNSPVLTTNSIDYAYVNQIFTHNTGAYDPDGDSLAFELFIPLADQNVEVPNYVYPHLLTPPPATLTLNQITGDMIWDRPTYTGVVNVGIIVKEYRRIYVNGVLNSVLQVGWVKRDLQIIITDSNNKPPIIAQIQDTCVVAGSTVNYLISATDPNPNQIITLSNYGGPFLVPSSPATFVPNTPGLSFSTGLFNWNTNCTHISPNAYVAVVEAKDNTNPIPLFDIKTFRIKVVGPPVQNVQATPLGNSIVVTWDNPYVCSTVQKFLGFSVWRREGPNPFAIDTCTPGLDGKGYTKIASGLTNYSYTDAGVIIGKNYCYRVLAEFGVPTSLGYITEFTESLPSNEACTQLKKDIPVMTKASVLITDPSSGSIEVNWSKPSKTELDTIQNPGPYKYELFRSEGYTPANQQLIQTFTANNFFQLNDSSFIDTGLNTVDKAYNYFVRFYSASNEIGDARYASSVFLKIQSAGNALKLNWELDVPWTNTEYHIYRKNPLSGLFDSIGISLNTSYIDAPLINDSTYCYKIKSIGAYSITTIISPIINFSQEVCGIPVDTIGPCAPQLTISNKCNTTSYTFDDFTNFLTWTKPNEDCGGDAVKYFIYYAPYSGEALNILDSISSVNDTTYLHQLIQSVAGCYAIAAVDSFDNIGERSAVICLDNCPLYELPNTFTPNNDGKNDLFIPIKPYRYIQKINMNIYTSWGNLVFQTNDPDILWDGTDQQTGKKVPDGTYYYVCEVFEERLELQTKPSKTLNGFIHLYR